MSRSKEYQHLLNSKRWRILRATYFQEYPVCEMCESEGRVSATVDIHHIRPVESARSPQEMEDLCFSWSNLQALCIRHHRMAHQDMNSNTREGHQKTEANRTAKFKAGLTHKPKYLK